MAEFSILRLNSDLLGFLKKQRTMVISSCDSSPLSERVYYALDHGFIFLLEKGSAALELAAKGREFSFLIETKNPSLTVQGTGKLQVLGSPASHDSERGLLISKVPQAALLLESAYLVRLVPTLISVSDVRDEPKRYSVAVSPDELTEKPQLAIVRAIRPWSLQMSVSAFILGVLLAHRFSLLIVPAILALVMAHGAFNMLSDYMDFRLNVDSPLGMGSSGSRVLVDRLISPSFHIKYAVAMLSAAVALAALLIAMAPQISIAVAVGVAAGLLYSVPRIGLKFNALGDLGVFLAFGPGIVLGAVLLVGAAPTVADLLVSIGIGMVIVAVLHANNWRDIKSDSSAGVKTMATLLGERGSKYYYLGLIWLSYITFALAVVLDRSDWPILGSLLTVPWAIKLTRVALNEKNWNRKVLDVKTGFFTALHMYFTIAFLAAVIIIRLI